MNVLIPNDDKHWIINIFYLQLCDVLTSKYHCFILLVFYEFFVYLSEFYIPANWKKIGEYKYLPWQLNVVEFVLNRRAFSACACMFVCVCVRVPVCKCLCL